MKILVIGAGVIGLAVARELAGGKNQVTVLDPAMPGTEASWAAAGMLCPDSEPHPHTGLQSLRLAARDLYPEFVAGLERETGLNVGFHTEGTLSFMPDGSVDEALREPEAVWRPARFFPNDYSVDNRRLTQALEKSCRERGVHFRPVAVRAVELASVVLADGQILAGDVIINAAGCWSSQIPAPGVTFEVRPVKGQMAAVQAEGWSLRYIVRSDHVYLVPRYDGRILVGATMEESGYDKTVHKQTIDGLLSQAAQLVPKIRNAPVIETWAGLRPATPSGLPLIGPTSLPGYYLATGHFRNGILLAPITAQLLAESIRTGKTPPLLRPFASA